MDKPTPYLLQKFTAKLTHQEIVTTNWKGISHMKEEDITKAEEEFYTQLFNTKEADKAASRWISKHLKNKISRETKEELERDLMNEINHWLRYTRPLDWLKEWCLCGKCKRHASYQNPQDLVN
eukprot:Phypoly_transcript_12714.p1 GENE.Phypoly_transcript_12714~~Phypoly_transcript_12714.p1  ORF type:complete len:123 (+),score=21.73 Phypoly_transcript_12714:455-823(+)